jgi:general secretion pathway protein D
MNRIFYRLTFCVSLIGVIAFLDAESQVETLPPAVGKLSDMISTKSDLQSSQETIKQPDKTLPNDLSVKSPTENNIQITEIPDGSIPVQLSAPPAQPNPEEVKDIIDIIDFPVTEPALELSASKSPKNKGSRKVARQKKEQEKAPIVTMADVALPGELPSLTSQEKKQANEHAIKKLTESGAIYLGQYLEPWKGADPDERVEMNFDNEEISELLKFLSEALDITFILDDYIEPHRAEGLQPIAGTKITFKSTVPLSLKEAWDIGLTFLEMAGFSIIPATQPRTYRVTTSASRDKPSANREPMPTFIGIDPEILPDSDAKIRYVYFAENADLPTVVQIIEQLKSSSAGPIIEVPPLRAVIMTDKAANIKSVMGILREIDQVTLPETISIIRLKHTDAREVRELYYRLIGKDPKSTAFNPYIRQRKPSTIQYFTEATRIFEEPYTNSLIVLGTHENIRRFEDFVKTYVDKTLDVPFSPLHIIQLKYIDATSIAKILNEVIQKFNAYPTNSSAAQVGGVRDGNKFFKPTVRITDEPSGNRLIINADYEEFLKLRDVIQKLDVEQPQVIIKILILNVDLTNTNELGVQLRNSVASSDGTGGLDNILGKNLNFQTSMLGPVITNPPAGTTPSSVPNGAVRLLGNLINLASSNGGASPFSAGSTLVTLGKDMFGFWGLLQALESYTRTSVVANPFLVATHKYKAEFKVGETRRTTTAIVTGQTQTQSQGDIDADLRIVITPQISYDDMVDLNVYIELGQFTDSTTQNRILRKISTEALLANREVLALGGFIQDRITETIQKVPVLGDIPFFGWLFKKKSKIVERSSLLILICPEIIKSETVESYTFSKIADVKDTLYSMRSRAEERDPIHRWFFNDHKEKQASALDKFVATQQRYIDASQRMKESDDTMKTKPVSSSPVKQDSLLDLIGQEGALV